MSRVAREVPWLGKIGDVFYVFWYDKEARRTARASLRTEAADEAAKLYANFLVTGKAVYDKVGSDLTVSKMLDDYEREHVNTSPVADKARQRIAIKHLRTHFGDLQASLIDIPSCRAYGDARRTGRVGEYKIGGGKRIVSTTAGDSTIRRELVVLNAAINHAIRWKRLTMAEKPILEKPADRAEEKPYYSRDDLSLLIAMAEPTLKRFMRLLYWTGARRRAIEHLMPRQIDWTSGSINLLTPGKQQTKKRMPVVPIYDEIRDDLATLCKGRGPTDPLFTSGMYVPYVEHCAGLGLQDRGYPHIMRHTRATHMLQDGVSIYDVAKLLGDTVQTIERTYGHHSVEVLKERTR